MWKPIRKFLNDIHLYAGLISGLIVIVVCLSGTIYVYNTEIRETADAERYFVTESGDRQTLDALKADLEDELSADVVGVNVLTGSDRSVQFQVKKADEERTLIYFVNPYSGAILADNVEKTSTEEFMGYLFSLHRWLLLDKIEEPILDSMTNQELGRFINGVATLLFLLGVMTGIFIWFPQKVKNWKQGLSVRWSGNWKRVNHDLHNTLAFYSLGALFIMAVTGPFWSYQWYKTGWQKTFDTYQPPKEGQSSPAASESSPAEELTVPVYTLSLDEILVAANKHLDYSGNVRITLPEEAGKDIAISKSRAGFFARAGADQLKLSPETLEVKEANLFGELPVRQQIGRSVKALHTGEIFGQFTKFLWFIACLIATSLPITGTLIWWNKRKKKKTVSTKLSKDAQAEMA